MFEETFLTVSAQVNWISHEYPVNKATQKKKFSVGPVFAVENETVINWKKLRLEDGEYCGKSNEIVNVSRLKDM